MNPSLLDPPAVSVLAEASGWVTGTLLGSLAVGLCVIAVASIGLMMLAGRVPMREGLTVIVGCFVLAGAPAIGAAFLSFADAPASPSWVPRSAAEASPVARDLPPADYDPYAGASVRGD